MDTQKFIQLTIDALTLGSVYALIALGYTLVYGVLKLLNFAHGDVFMVGTYIGFGVLQALRRRVGPRPPDVGAPGRDDARGHGRLRNPRRGDRTLRVPARCGTHRESRR